MEERDNSRRSAVFGHFCFDLSSHELRKHGTKIRLEEKPALLLWTLIDGAGAVVSREELHRLLWPNGEHVDFDHGLNKCINKLRFVLADDSSKPRFIETLSRRGYRFIAPIEILNETTPDQAGPSIPPLAPVTGRQGSEGSVNLFPEVARAAPAEASWWRKRKFGAGLAVAVGLLTVVLLVTARRSFLAGSNTPAAVLIQQNGAIDPLDEGFKVVQIGKLELQVMRNATDDGWNRLRVINTDQGYYYHPLSDAETRFALDRDWKLTLSCLSWKWRERSSVKIAERTYEERTEAFHSRRKSGHPEAASCGQSTRLGAV